LTAENIDWPTRSLTYFRMKTGEQAQPICRYPIEVDVLSRDHKPDFKATFGGRAVGIEASCQKNYRKVPEELPEENSVGLEKIVTNCGGLCLIPPVEPGILEGEMVRVLPLEPIPMASDATSCARRTGHCQ
jgi:hypothetical protein